MIGIFTYFSSKLIEAIFLFISYITLRYAYPKTWHSKNFYVCIFFSILSFWIALPLTAPLSISLFSSVIIGSLIGFILYKVQDYVDTKLEVIELNKTIIINNTISLKALSEYDLCKLCKEYGLTDIQCDIVKYLVIDEFHDCEIYKKIGYCKANYYIIKKKIKSIDVFKNL